MEAGNLQLMERMIKVVFMITCCIIFMNAKIIAQQKNYYLSVSGNDNNNGFSRQTAWRSVNKINTTDFKPGDSVFFEGGSVFDGTIKLTSGDNGAQDKPVVFTSYGNGKAVINAGEGEGLLAVNTSFIKIVSLIFKGSGVAANKGSGIHFFANDSLHAPTGADINNCDVKGFHNYGIVFSANDTVSFKGYQQVRITHCNTSENGDGGIASYGSFRGFQHKDFYIAYCKTFNNRGILTKTENHSGNGIVMGMVQRLLIEHCEAYENGADNHCNAGGPVGIWVWMCKNAIIQNCIAHNNHTGSAKDGGGFDIDGGSSSCILQNNYLYNNDGAGYLLAEYGAMFPFTNNIIRFNISVNDGRKNDYGALSVWGAGGAYKVTNTYVYNNTFYIDDKNLVAGTPAAVTFIGSHFENLIIANNIFVTKGNVNFINSDTIIKQPVAYLLHNNYYSYGDSYSFKYGATFYSSLQQWLKNNTDQERAGNKAMYLNINPLFKNISFENKDAFRLQDNSLLRNQQFSLPVYFSVNGNIQDMDGNTLPAGKETIPGAYTK